MFFLKDDEEREREEKKHHLYQLKQQLEHYLQELPVVGFNTGKYDVNAMKVNFFTRLVDSHKIKYTVKRNNKNTGQHIRHQGNDNEKVIVRRRLPVEGFCKETNTVYQGCLWHGHRCCITKDKSVNPINGKSLDDMCEWGRLKKQEPELKAFITDRRSCDVQFKMTEETILQAVMDEKLFGALEVDLHVPDDLKPKFTEMPPV